MVRQFFKKKSKRVSAKKRYKIEKKVRAHNKKKSREEKKTVSLAKQKKRDPGVPNSLPFKDEVLKEAEEWKKKREDEREAKKERRKANRATMLAKKRNLENLVSDAQKRGKEFERKESSLAAGEGKGKAVESSLKAYYKEFKKVVDAADVVLEVLDARDPLGSRCPQVEEAILSSGTNKRLVLVLNKIDLVPKDNVEKWLKYLRNEFPTVAFKACTQTQKDNLSQSRVPVAQLSEDLLKSSKCLGADLLMKLLGNYCRNKDIKTAIRVGVVGFPNTGKSSIINSLKRSKSCNVGATPGVTKSMQEIQLDKHIKLLDSPGIVMASGSSDAHVILRNAVKVETLEDPVKPVEAILKRCNKQQMMIHYNLPNYADVHEFLSLLAKRFGRLKKGGLPDSDKAAKSVLQDWNNGRITYYTHPPEESKGVQIASEIVQEMSSAFDIEALLSEEAETLKGLKMSSSSDMVVESLGPADLSVPDDSGMEDDEEEEDDEDKEEEDMHESEEEELKSTTVSMKGGSRSRKSTVSKDDKKPKAATSVSSEDNLQLGKQAKKDWKKAKKQRKRADKLAGQLSDALTGALDSLGSSKSKAGDDSYDFSVDFK